jgi:hypothetical protein
MTHYWYCVKHHAVEHGADICPPIDRLGPFDSEAEAAQALELAERRNQEWDDEDD